MPPVSGRAPRWLPSLRRHYERAACVRHASRCISSVAPGCRAAAQGSAPAPLLGLAKPHAGGRHLSADHGSPSFSKLTREQQCLKWLRTVPAGEGLVCKRLSSFLRAADLPSSRGRSPAGRAFRLRYNTHRTRPPHPRRWSRLLTPGVSQPASARREPLLCPRQSGEAFSTRTSATSPPRLVLRFHTRASRPCGCILCTVRDGPDFLFFQMAVRLLRVHLCLGDLSFCAGSGHSKSGCFKRPCAACARAPLPGP